LKDKTTKQIRCGNAIAIQKSVNINVSMRLH